MAKLKRNDQNHTKLQNTENCSGMMQRLTADDAELMTTSEMIQLASIAAAAATLALLACFTQLRGGTLRMVVARRSLTDALTVRPTNYAAVNSTRLAATERSLAAGVAQSTASSIATTPHGRSHAARALAVRSLLRSSKPTPPPLARLPVERG